MLLLLASGLSALEHAENYRGFTMHLPLLMVTEQAQACCTCLISGKFMLLSFQTSQEPLARKDLYWFD